MRVSHRTDFTIKEFSKTPSYCLTGSIAGDLLYRIGRTFTSVFAWQAANATAVFGPHKAPGSSATSYTTIQSAMKAIVFAIGLVPSVALAALGYPLRLLGSLFKDGMSLIESDRVKPKVYDKSQGLHLMTYNIGLMPAAIRNLNDLRSSNERAAHLAAILSAQKDEASPDVICFQEAFDMDAGRLLCDGLRGSFHHILHNVAPSETGLGSGLVVASKYPILEARYRPFTDLAAEDAFANKGLLRIVVDLGNGRTAVIYNTHLQAKEGPAYAKIRQEEIKQVRAWMEEDTASDEKSHVGIFLTGDFNVAHRLDTGLESPEYDIAAGILSSSFTDPYYKDHDRLTERRIKNRARFLEPSKEEPRGSWYEGPNPAKGQSRSLWGQKTWHAKHPVMERCIYDHQFIFDKPGQDRFDTHAEIRHLFDEKASSGLSDHLPLSVIYKEKD